ncbi:hypothetical protein ACFYY8_18780 [Streptosporangium sp. NPDC001559]|uniref:hypothetical protein n=1 Tax=Streptosporangium sp. NPDC001559 TaxID=3366187 RepID=UPI0036EE2821
MARARHGTGRLPGPFGGTGAHGQERRVDLVRFPANVVFAIVAAIMAPPSPYGCANPPLPPSPLNR